MSRMMASLVVLTLSAGAAMAQAIPSYNIQAQCRQSTRAMDGTGERMSGCVKDEEAAKAQIAAVWDKAHPSTRRSCAGDQGYHRSYVDVLTCMQMFENTLPWTK